LPQGQGIRCYGFRSSDGLYAHCTRGERAGGIQARETQAGTLTYAHRLKGDCKCGVQHGPADIKPPSVNGNGTHPSRKKIAETPLVVKHPDRTSFGQHVRIDYDDGSKDFVWRMPDGSPSNGRIKSNQAPLYGVEHLSQYPNQAVVLVEGEKPQKALAERGILAVATVTGADGTPCVESLQPLAGRDVYPWPDNDPDGKGQRHMGRIEPRLVDIGARPHMLTWPAAPPKGDAFDFFAMGGTVEELEEMMAAADTYQADPETEDDIEPERKRFELLTPQQILNRPAPERLIDDLLIANSTAMIVGDSGSGKTVLALDLAHCVASGRWWNNRKVKPGPVLYVHAESGADLHLRLQAWAKANGQPLPENIYFLEEVVRLLEPGDVDLLLDRIAELPEPPVFVIIDTLARSMAGGDENSTADMGLYVDALERLRRATKANVTVVHHTNKSGLIRGNSSLRAALDTVIEVKRDDDFVTLSCDKQKGIGPFKTIRMQVEIVPLGEYWPGESSVVLSGLVSNRADTFDSHMKIVADTLVDTFGDLGATATQLEAVCIEQKMGRATYYRAKKSLVEQGFMVADKEGRGARYRPAKALWDKLQSLRDLPDTYQQNGSSVGI